MQNRRDEHNSIRESNGPPAKKLRKPKDSESPGDKKRFMNAFMLFRQGSHQQVQAQYPRYQSKNGTISKIISTMWAAKTDAEQQPWFDEYLELRRLDPDFIDNPGDQRPRRKMRKEADRLKAVAQLQLIQKQNAKGEELVFSDDHNEITRLLEQHDIDSSSDGINGRPNDRARILQGPSEAVGLGIEMNQDLSFDPDLNPQTNQRNDREQPVSAEFQSHSHDLEVSGQGFDFDNDINLDMFLNFEEE
ncbi:hypothetical protein NPX13_g5954 [Xylaria arbuscula]|uniref:HMG box domain-containing protein n=1 Tax=Xylaria arbuscula TaxID=114810 RepID=A0A9W8TMM5_9PEZI|nr:hypothetical protein NPX13_g5954 [Xylaria arbuscula]